MQLTLGAKSMMLFGISVIFLLLLTSFESMLSGISTAGERVISFLLLVLPGIVGVILGVLSFVRKESQRWLAALGILLNALFALFQMFVISFAG